MPCFCYVPASVPLNRLNLGLTPMLPTAPLTLRLAAALPALENRLDMQIATGFDAMRLPNIDFGGGPMAQLAMTLSMMVGTFALDDLPMLEFQMQQAAVSVARNVWPRLSWLTQLKIQPLLNYAIIARLVLDLQALGIDPFRTNTFPPPPAIHSFRFALSPPQLQMVRLLAGLPPLMKLTEALNLPPLGETGAVSALQNRLNGLARLTPPKLLIPMPLLTKLAMVLESLATIQEAFGDAFSPSTLGRVDAMLKLWGNIPFLIPLDALALNAKLQALPLMEDIRLGERIAGHSGATLAMPFSPPRLVIAPFMNVIMALHASMQVALDMEPFDMCSMCNCA